MSKKIIISATTLLLFFGLVSVVFLGKSKTTTIKGRQKTSEEEIKENENQNVAAEQGIVTQENLSAKQATETENEPDGEEKSSVVEIEKDEEAEKSKDTTGATKTDLVSWGFSSGRSEKVDTVVVHSVYNKLGGDRYSLSKILDIFKDYGVAAHYIIERDGKVTQLVAEKNTAFHAGSGQMSDGRGGVNDFSIGIELINSEDDKPTSSQYDSLDDLVDQIKDHHKIKYILGHSDIAPGRKTDPWNFDWEKIGGKKD